MKLWQKDYNIDKEIEKFTVGDDFILDKNLIKYDVMASIAHAIMLNKIKILTDGESKKIISALKEIIKLNENNKFVITQEDEDAHTAIENYLTKKLGSLGKKIHTARSRNDQVLVDTRLYTKEKILEVKESLIELIKSLQKTAADYQKVPMPGYTHMQKAMPSSVGLLFASYAESLSDTLDLLDKAYDINNQSPLGSAAGYGASIEIDRKLTADLLGFQKVQNNTLYVQNSRGKIESIIIFSLSQIMNDLGKIANDLILFSMSEFKYFTLPDKFCTGSSIMPQKKNPVVLELLRAKAAVVNSNLFQVYGIMEKLPSGYNRDYQLIKKPLMESFDTTLASSNIMNLIISNIIINKEKCISACTPDLFAADEAYKLVKSGIPFRDAYQEIAKNINNLKINDPTKNILAKKHIGASGNLGINKKATAKFEKELKQEKQNFNKILKNLIG